MSLVYSIGFGRASNTDVIVSRFQYLCGTIKRTLLEKNRIATVLKFYKVTTVSTQLYGA